MWTTFYWWCSSTLRCWGRRAPRSGSTRSASSCPTWYSGSRTKKSQSTTPPSWLGECRWGYFSDGWKRATSNLHGIYDFEFYSPLQVLSFQYEFIFLETVMECYLFIHFYLFFCLFDKKILVLNKNHIRLYINILFKLNSLFLYQCSLSLELEIPSPLSLCVKI